MANKKTQPLVSSIIIFLNAQRFIEEAIQSVFAQTYDNWELLLVDDGSTDGSTEIALRYAERYPGKVRYLEHAGHQNRGMSASRNLGIANAGGEYIAFLDADDVWLEHKLERQVAILNSHPEAGMVYGLSQYWYSWTGELEDSQRDIVPELGVKTNTLFNPPALLTVLFPLGDATSPSSSDLLVRRESVERVGGYEEIFEGVFEDQAFLVKMFLKEPVFVADELWDRYRLHANSYSAVVMKTSRYHQIRLLFLVWLAEYLTEQGVEDAEAWGLLREHQRFARVRVYAYKREWWRAIGAVLALLRYHPRRFSARVLRRLIARA